MSARRSSPGAGTRAVRAGAVAVALAAIAVGGTAAPASAAPIVHATGRVSVTTAGAQATQQIGAHIRTDATGRYVAFSSTAALSGEDTNGVGDAYLRDRVAGTTRRVSLTDAGGQIDGPSQLCGMSRNARFIGFSARGNGLPVTATNQIYLRDRALGTTTIVSVSSTEVPSFVTAADSGVTQLTPCPISDDGRHVSFVSYASTLAPGDDNAGKTDVFRRDLQAGVTVRASIANAGGSGANMATNNPAMSGDGATVAFETQSSNLVAGDTNGVEDVFVHLFGSGGTFRMSVKAGGGQVFSASFSPSLSADGTKVAFASYATDLVQNDTNSAADVFLRNRTTNTIVRASLVATSSQIASASDSPSLSDDGTKVSFTVDEPDVIVDDANQDDDVYLRDLQSASTSLVSVAPSSATGNAGSSSSWLAGNGSAVAFRSYASDLVRKDDNGTDDVFVRDLGIDLAPFTSTSALVKQQFVDFEGRQPTAAELTEWTARFSNGERTADQLIDDLAHGTTFAGKRAPLIRLYWAFFKRPPDQNGLDYWTKKLTNGAKLASVAKQFSTSSEFQTKYGNTTNVQFVSLVYQNIFDRDPDPSGLAYWTNKLNTGQKTRGDVMVNFSESSEGKRVLAPQTDTILHHVGMLKTMPSKLYIDLFLSGLKGEWISAQQVGSIRASQPYATRVTP